MVACLELHRLMGPSACRLHEAKLRAVVMFVPLHEDEQVGWDFDPQTVAAMADLFGNVLGNVARPALSSVEAHNANRIAVLAIQHLGNSCLEVGRFIGLAPRAATAAEVVQNQIDGVGAGNDGWGPATHTQLRNCNGLKIGRQDGICESCGRELLRAPVAFQGTNLEERMAAKKKTARGRKQDRARVAGGQRYEVGYEAKKTKRSRAAVKKAVKKVGNSRKKVERRLSR